MCSKLCISNEGSWSLKWMGRHNVHEPKDRSERRCQLFPNSFPSKCQWDYFIDIKGYHMIYLKKKKGRWTRVIDLVWERMEWDGLVLLQVAVADTVWYWKMRGARRWYRRQSGRVENPGTDLQGCSTDFDKRTEAVQGAGELISGTREIGHLSKITKEPELRLHCRKTNSKGRHRGLTCKI